MALARRILTTAVAMAATFGVLWAGQALAHQTMVASPVARAVRLQGVRSYAMATGDPSMPTVRVQLKNGIDLQTVAETLDNRLTPILGVTPVIDPVGPGQTALRGAVEAVALPVEQGVATGQFVSMDKAVVRLAGAQGIVARVEVDSQAVYVTLTPKTGGGEAYAIFPRSATAPNQTSNAGVTP